MSRDDRFPMWMARALLLTLLVMPTTLLAQMRFQAGRHYTVLQQPQSSGLAPAGRIEVAEVFSYACGACYQVQAVVKDLAAALPADAAMTYVHAGFSTGWGVFQQAHLTAQALGIAEREHARLFAAIWETGEVPFIDRATGQPRRPPLQIGDLAKFHATGGGVTEAQFLARANSPAVKDAVARTDALIKAWQVGATPTFVVAGRYRIESRELATEADLKALVNHLVTLERARLQSRPKKD